MVNNVSNGKKPFNITQQKVNYFRPKDFFRPESTICKAK